MIEQLVQAAAPPWNPSVIRHLPASVRDQLDLHGHRFQRVQLPDARWCLPPGRALPLHLKGKPIWAHVDLLTGEIACEDIPPLELQPILPGNTAGILDWVRGILRGPETLPPGVPRPEPPPLPEDPSQIDTWLSGYQRYLEQTVAAYVTSWIDDVLGLSGGPFETFLPLIFQFVVSCFSPRVHTERLVQELRARDAAYIQQLPRMRSAPAPRVAEPIPRIARAMTLGGKLPFGQVGIVVPYDQDVEISWRVVGHAAVCKESSGIAEIVGNQDGHPVYPFRKEVTGFYKFPFETITNVDQGTTTIHLPSGGYVARVVGSNPESGGEITIRYNTVPALGVDLATVLVVAGIALTVTLGGYAIYEAVQ